MKVTNGYPLQWPQGYERSKRPQHSRFKATMGKATQTLILEINRLGGSAPIISSNIPLRNDGLPRATYKKLEDDGVAVYFTYKGSQMVLCCDKWDCVADNIQAVCKTIEALRGLDRWGVSDMLDRAFMGFKALPDSARTKHWWEVLDVACDSSSDEIHSAYRRLAKLCHPDTGGDPQQFRELNQAYEAAKKTFRP